MRRILTGLMFIALVGAPVVYGEGFVFVATPLDNDDISLAEDLSSDIPNCTVVGYWNTSSQSWVQHVDNTPINNFAVETGMPYMATVTADGIWTLCGGVPDSTDYIDKYTLAVGFSTIMLPLNMTYYDYAEEVIQSISQCNVMAYWNAASQSWVQHIQGTPINNFQPRVGYPYMLTCQSAGTWPSTLPPAKEQVDNPLPQLREGNNVMKLGAIENTNIDR